MYRHLLVPVDDSALSDKAMTASIELARRLGASVTAITVEPAPPPVGSGHSAAHHLQALEIHTARSEQHAERLMARFDALAQAAGVAFTGRYANTGRIDDVIAQVAITEHCDLIVMATHGRSGFDELVHRSRTREVIRRTRLPLLVLR